nr:hypothetical protein [Tanacetum cinerariifolium]
MESGESSGERLGDRERGGYRLGGKIGLGVAGFLWGRVAGIMESGGSGRERLRDRERGDYRLGGKIAFAMLVACASRAAVTLSATHCLMTARVMAGASDVEVLLGGILST